MPISHQHKCIFVHIPKCAGTSIEAALGVHGDNRRIGLEPNLRQMRDDTQLFGAGAQHYSIREIKDRVAADVFDGYFKFAFVRNPWARVVSHVAWRADASGQMKWHRQVALSQEEFNQAVRSLFSDWLRRRPFHEHLRPQRDFLNDHAGRLAVDFVGHVETIGEDWSCVEKAIGVSLPLERRMGSTHDDFLNYYNPLSFLAVAMIYLKDVLTLGYWRPRNWRAASR